ncbi:MAG: RHS repeat-associated core domain-containing protein [Phycisphaerae bacterium]|nr:RHS repeat-associated core domain-containing protein [Phycisphaerae bacterium]
MAFTYDALGRRIEKIVDSGGAQVEVTRYYYDGQNVVLETDADEAPRRSFVHGSQYVDERVLMRLPNGAEYYYLPRELYSVAALTDETGTIVEAATYDTYGKVAVYDGSAQTVEESPVGNPYYFTGRRLDLLPTVSSPQPAAKQLYHYRARAYGPGNGRFLQRDPAAAFQSPNSYEYSGCSPAVSVDPLGLFWGDVLDAIVGLNRLDLALKQYFSDPQRDLPGLIGDWKEDEWAVEVMQMDAFQKSLIPDLTDKIENAGDKALGDQPCGATVAVDSIVHHQAASSYDKLSLMVLGTSSIRADAHCLFTKKCPGGCACTSYHCSVDYLVHDRFDFNETTALAQLFDLVIHRGPFVDPHAGRVNEFWIDIDWWGVIDGDNCPKEG